MTAWKNLDKSSISELLHTTKARYEDLKSQQLNLDLTRGKPSSAQLDLSDELLSLPGKGHHLTEAGLDCRNYGGLEGLDEARRLFAPLLDAEPDDLILGGNASLTMMHDAVWRALTHGVPDGHGPWSSQGAVKFLCPVPGYDRHFSLLENFGVEMIPVPLGPQGPDMAVITDLVAKDPSIKGIFCVPKYSNPTGCTYSDDVVQQLAEMTTKAPDFRIFWDNAYSVHFLNDAPAPLMPLIKACKDAGHTNRPLVFGSTSKITFAGAGIGFMATSPDNRKDALAHMGKQTIGPDKINALRHVMFFKNFEGLLDHMRKHAQILKPKFDAIQSIFEKELAGTGILEWTQPEGGYFVSIDTLPGCASRVVTLAEQAGVKLTAAGATFPLSQDPDDRNIRLAPSMPPLEEVRTAMTAVAVAIQLASLEKLSAE